MAFWITQRYKHEGNTCIAFGSLFRIRLDGLMPQHYYFHFPLYGGMFDGACFGTRLILSVGFDDTWWFLSHKFCNPVLLPLRFGVDHQCSKRLVLPIFPSTYPRPHSLLLFLVVMMVVSCDSFVMFVYVRGCCIYP
jgi:hypothetical protein